MISDIIISFAANLISDIFLNSVKKNKLEKETNKAFEKALEKWTKNKDIARRKYYDLNFFINLLKKGEKTDISSSDMELLSFFYDELQNNPLTSDLLTRKLIELELNDSKNKIKYYDQTHYENHFNIYHNNEIKVDNLFIEPNYSISNISGSTIENNNFVDDCLKILENNRIILISGGYGAGKTIASKYLQHLLKSRKNKTIFLDACHFENFNEIEILESIDSLFRTDEKLYLFIDSFDTLSNEDTDKYLKQIKKISTIYNFFKEIRIIINHRTIEKEDDFQLHILEYLEVDCHLIKINYFDTEKIKKWIDKYNELTGSEYQYIILKKSKGLINSFSIPLFLYVYLSESKSSYEITDIYNAFSSFVSKTVRGKFVDEKKGNYFLEEKNIKEEEYYNFLTEIAFEIHRESMISNDLPIDEFFDTNENVIFLKETIVSTIIKRIFGEKINQEDEGLLNCYFFKKYKDCWGFRDNNLAYFLVANKIFVELKDFITNCNTEKKLINTISGISITPISYEFIFHFLEKNDINNQALVHSIKQLIIKEEILSVTNRKNDILSYNILTTDIFFFIIFLRYNRTPFSQEINYILKRISNYHSLAKKIDPNLSHVTRRYFKKSKIENAELRRINLKGYNFDYSELNNIKFIQNKIESARFNNVHFVKTQYDLCLLKKSEFKNISGEIEIKNSFLHEIDLLSIKNSSNITFIGCKIQKVILNSENKTITSAPKIVFKDCIIEQLSISNSAFIFDMADCIIKAKILANHSNIIIAKNGFIFSKIDMNEEAANEAIEKIEETVMAIKSENFKIEKSKIGYHNTMQNINKYL